MKILRWNQQKHNYDEVEISSDWKCKLYTTDMKEIINCINCGKELEYGNSYTSLEYQTNMGMGYPVCPKCHDLEFERRYNEQSN